MNYQKLQEKLLLLLPIWNYQITKPFKQLLDEGVSLEMFYAIEVLLFAGGTVTMTEFAGWSKMPKHQATKMANKLVEQGFAERFYDADDRRLVNIKIIDKGNDYINHFFASDAQCFKPMFGQLSEQDVEDLNNGLDLISKVLFKLPYI